MAGHVYTSSAAIPIGGPDSTGSYTIRLQIFLKNSTRQIIPTKVKVQRKSYIQGILPAYNNHHGAKGIQTATSRK